MTGDEFPEPRGPVLVTGANGFVGRAVLRALEARRWPARAAVRARPPDADRFTSEWMVVGDLAAGADWAAAVSGVDAVVHLAARVHVMRETATDALSAFRRINVDATRSLARAARDAGVRRFVYVSTVKVHGEASSGRAFTELDAPAPADPYAQSKWEAEQALAEIAAGGAMETVVLRPPLVYGPGVRANFLALAQAVRRGIPLPFGAVRNRRSLVYVGNLADAILAVLASPHAARETFLVDDGCAVSTADLVRAMARAMGRHPRLPAVPAGWLRVLGRLAGREAAVERLVSDLEIDSSRLRRVVGWTPPFDLDAGLRATLTAPDRP